MVQDNSMINEADIKKDIIIEKFLNGGAGLGHDSDGKPLFVEGAYPGEIVDVQVIKDKKSYAFGKVVDVKYKIPERNQAVCGVFKNCGACDWLDLDYAFQLKSKMDIIKEQFLRLGGIDIEKEGIIEEIIPSEPHIRTRNKMTYAFGIKAGTIVLGLKEKGSNKVIEPKGCRVVDEQFEKIRRTVQEIIREAFSPDDVFSHRNKKGFLRGITIRKSEYTGQYMLIFTTSAKITRFIKVIKENVKKTLPFIDSVINVFTRKKNILSGEYATIYGSGTIREHIDWFEYNIPPTSFFQTNSKMLKVFLNKVKELSNPLKSEVLMDLYGGVGFFTIFLSPLYKRCVLVESHAESAKAAISNCSINKVTNTLIIEKTVEEFMEPNSEPILPDTLIIDPPRAGIDKTAIDGIIQLKPKKIIYCSCDLGTLIRDASKFQETGYKIDLIQPIDMFPNTAHVECVVLMSRVKE